MMASNTASVRLASASKAAGRARCRAPESRPAARAARRRCADSTADRPAPAPAPRDAPWRAGAHRASPGESRRCRCATAAAAPGSSRRARRDWPAGCARSARCRRETAPAARSRWRDPRRWRCRRSAICAEQHPVGHAVVARRRDAGRTRQQRAVLLDPAQHRARHADAAGALRQRCASCWHSA